MRYFLQIFMGVIPALFLSQAFAGALDPYLACANALNSEELEGIYSFSAVLSPSAKPRIPVVSTRNYAVVSGQHKTKSGFFVFTADRAFFFDPGLKSKEPLSALVWEDSVCFKLSTPNKSNPALYLEFHASWDDPQQGYFNFLANDAAPVGFKVEDLKGGANAQYALDADKKCKPLKPATELLTPQTRALLEKEFLDRFTTMMTSDFPREPSAKLLKEMEAAMTSCKKIDEPKFRSSVVSAEKVIREKMPRDTSGGTLRKKLTPKKAQ